MKTGSNETNHQTIQNLTQNESFSQHSSSDDKKNMAPRGLSLRPNRSVVRNKSLRPKPMLPLRSVHKEDTEDL